MCTPTGNRSDDRLDRPLQRLALPHVPVLFSSGLAGLVAFLLARLVLEAPAFGSEDMNLAASSGVFLRCTAGWALTCRPADVIVVAGFIAVLPMTYWVATREIAETRGLVGVVTWTALVTVLASFAVPPRSSTDLLATLMACLAVFVVFEAISDQLRLTFRDESGTRAT